MKIDPGSRGRMPKVGGPVPFKDGRIQGWRIALPDKRPLATPAVMDGRVFIGGGFGGYEFYAFDAATGQLAWEYQTEDDGPTAAVVCDGCVLFNTESCELEVLTVEGKRVWKKWLGDPLMSMPAVDKGKVFMVYPDSGGDHGHNLSCFDLYTGAQVWKTPIAGEVITAPVLSEDRVYFTTLDGAVGCLRQDNGAFLWNEPSNATSSPMVWNGQCYFSRRQEEVRTARGKKETYQNENLAARQVVAGSPTRNYHETLIRANYLDHGKRQMGSPQYVASAMADACVGFGGHKGDAKMEQAMRNLGRGHVHAVWAYQGSKPFISCGPDVQRAWERRLLRRPEHGKSVLEENAPRGHTCRRAAGPRADPAGHRERQVVPGYDPWRSLLP